VLKHEAPPVKGVKVPAAHGVHVAAAALDESCGPALPGWQIWPRQAVMPVSFVYSPDMQLRQGRKMVSPALPNVPGTHAWPAQEPRPLEGAHVPGRQREQVAAAAVVWPVGPYEPWGQMPPVTPGLHELLPFVAEKRPEGHGVQVAPAAVLLPSGANVPGGQGVPTHDPAPSTVE
jgi:hypothetical protein